VLSLSDALVRVQRQCAPDIDPILTPQEIADILTDGLEISTWLPSTAYVVGQVVIPIAPLGRVFRCVLPGTSDTFEPEWLIAPHYTGTVNPLGAWWGAGPLPFVGNVATTPWFWGLGDGSCAWRDFGAFAGELYDVQRATYAAWMLKAQKASSRVDSSLGGGITARESQTYQQCLAQARRYQSVRVM
jgi:hypothetical protein